MRARVFVEPQMGATYEQQLEVARTAERTGFDAFFRSDHFLTMGGDGLPGPTDSWVTLAGLARETTNIKLGTLLTSATFRLPGLLAVSVAEVDAMSGGRAELGLGAGWFEAEHTAYGVPFPSTKERFERLGEQLEIITGLWTTPVGATFSFDGTSLPTERQPGTPEARAVATPAGDRRRTRSEADTGPGCPVRERVQRSVRSARRRVQAIRARSRGVRTSRQEPERAHLLGRDDHLLWDRRRGA